MSSTVKDLGSMKLEDGGAPAKGSHCQRPDTLGEGLDLVLLNECSHDGENGLIGIVEG